MEPQIHGGIAQSVKSGIGMEKTAGTISITKVNAVNLGSYAIVFDSCACDANEH